MSTKTVQRRLKNGRFAPGKVVNKPKGATTKFKSKSAKVLPIDIAIDRYILIPTEEALRLIRYAINVALGEAKPISSTQPINHWDSLAKPVATPSKSKFYRPTPASGPAEQKTWTARIHEWIADYVGPRNDGRTDEDYRRAYKDAYRQLTLRHHVDVEARAANFAKYYIESGMPVPEGNRPIDFVEQLGLAEELFKIVCEMYPLDAVNPTLQSEPVLPISEGPAMMPNVTDIPDSALDPRKITGIQYDTPPVHVS